MFSGFFAMAIPCKGSFDQPRESQIVACGEANDEVDRASQHASVLWSRKHKQVRQVWWLCNHSRSRNSIFSSGATPDLLVLDRSRWPVDERFVEINSYGF